MINYSFAFEYHKIPIMSPGLTFVQKAFLLGLFSGELIFGGASYRKEFCIPKWVWLVNTNSLKQLKTANSNSPWAYIWKGLLSEGFLCLRFRGLILGRAFFGERGGGLLSECYGVWLIGTLPKFISDLFSEFLPENFEMFMPPKKSAAQ